jgi:hypothetical protein
MNSRRLAFLVLAALLGTGLALSLAASERSDDWRSFTLRLETELMGAMVLYVLLDPAIGRMVRSEEQREAERQRMEAEREAEKRRIAREKARLVEEMGSNVRDVAVAAAEKLSQRQWLYDGTLCDAYLACASLRDADLARARLQRADLHRAELAGGHLYRASLREADLSFANLEGAEIRNANLARSDLSFAKLAGASLESANVTRSDLSFSSLAGASLENASLTRSNLSHADLTGTNLQGANLRGADLKFAHLREAQFDEATELPDGTGWTQHSDLSRFTYPKHPDFWRSDDPVSPAYRGKDGD